MSANIFDTVSVISDAISKGLIGKATIFTHPDNPGDFTVISTVLWGFALTAEIIMCLLSAISGSGQQAIQRGVEAILVAAFVFAITTTTVWESTVIPIFQELEKEVVKPLGPSNETILTNIAQNIGDAIVSIMNRMPSTTSDPSTNTVSAPAAIIQRDIASKNREYDVAKAQMGRDNADRHAALIFNRAAPDALAADNDLAYANLSKLAKNHSSDIIRLQASCAAANTQGATCPAL